LTKAQAELVSLKEAVRTGQGPTSLAEKRQQAEIQRKAELAALQSQSYQRMSFIDYWTNYYLPQAQRSKKQSSWTKEAQHVKNWLAPAFGQLAHHSSKLFSAIKCWEALFIHGGYKETKTAPKQQIQEWLKQNGNDKNGNDLTKDAIKEMAKIVNPNKFTGGGAPKQ